MRGIVITLAALVLALALHTHAANACIEIIPHVVFPSNVAPRNAHVWVHGLPLPLYAGASFVLVASDRPSSPIATDLRSFESAGTVWELVPRALLDAGARYELWGVPRRKNKPLLLGTFTASASIDTRPPAAPALKSAERTPAVFGCSESVTLFGAPGADDSGSVLQAVWLAGDDGPIAYASPPQEIFAWPPWEGDAVPPPAEILVGVRAASRAKRIGVRAVDVAGNLSPPTEIELR